MKEKSTVILHLFIDGKNSLFGVHRLINLTLVIPNTVLLDVHLYEEKL